MCTLCTLCASSQVILSLFILIRFQLSLSGAPACIHRLISFSIQRTLPPILTGAGILPQLLSLKICLWLRLSLCPNVLALNNWHFCSCSWLLILILLILLATQLAH